MDENTWILVIESSTNLFIHQTFFLLFRKIPFWNNFWYQTVIFSQITCKHDNWMDPNLKNWNRAWVLMISRVKHARNEVCQARAKFWWRNLILLFLRDFLLLSLNIERNREYFSWATKKLLQLIQAALSDEYTYLEVAQPMLA